MELKEFMEKNGVSKGDIIMAGWLANEVCKSFDCGFCPYHIHEVDGAGICANSAKRADKDSVEKMVKERVQELLHPNHMEKVAEMLGVKLGEKFGVETPTSDVVNTYYLTKQGIFSEDNMSAEITLSNLLIGKACIIKGE